MGSWRNEIRKPHWLWLQKCICVSNSLPPSSPSHERVSYGQDKWLLHCPFCSCDLNTYSSESNHLLRSTNQTESFCHLIFSHGLWIKPKLHLAYKELPGPTFLFFRCLSLVLMKWKHRLHPHLILVLMMWKHRLPPYILSWSLWCGNTDFLPASQTCCTAVSLGALVPSPCFLPRMCFPVESYLLLYFGISAQGSILYMPSLTPFFLRRLSLWPVSL